MNINQSYYSGLSEFCDGTILSTSNESAVLSTRRVANFDFRCTTYWPRSPLLSSIAFAVYCVTFAVRRRIAGERFDLVSTYDPIKTGIIGALAARILCSRFAPEVNGVYTSDAEYIDAPRSLSLRMKKILIPAIIGRVLARAHGIKLLFDRQIDPFSDIVKGKLIRRFPAYVNTTKFSNLREDKEILFVGFPFKRKGVDVLISAFKRVAPFHPDWKLKILGWFPDTAQLNMAIDGHPQIFHHPPVYYPEMPSHLGSCAFLVLPSRSEAMGRVLVEAMACGKPRIGSDVDGIPTVINDGVDGLLVRPESVDDLAAALERLMSDEPLRKRMGLAAQLRARSEFTEEAHFHNLKSFFAQVVEAKDA